MTDMSADIQNTRELSQSEIDQVSAGIMFPPAVMKAFAWATGAGFGAGLVVAITYLFK